MAKSCTTSTIDLTRSCCERYQRLIDSFRSYGDVFDSTTMTIRLDNESVDAPMDVNYYIERFADRLDVRRFQHYEDVPGLSVYRNNRKYYSRSGA